ncbi:MAG: hypothetical protein Q9170_008153 [Blastenia crenularia]
MNAFNTWHGQRVARQLDEHTEDDQVEIIDTNPRLASGAQVQPQVQVENRSLEIVTQSQARNQGESASMEIIVRNRNLESAARRQPRRALGDAYPWRRLAASVVFVCVIVAFLKWAQDRAISIDNAPYDGRTEVRLHPQRLDPQIAIQLPGLIPLPVSHDPNVWAAILDKVLDRLPPDSLSNLGASSEETLHKLTQATSNVVVSINSMNDQLTKRLPRALKIHRLPDERSKLALVDDLFWSRAETFFSLHDIESLRSFYDTIETAYREYHATIAAELKDLQSTLSWNKVVDLSPQVIPQWTGFRLAGKYRGRLMEKRQSLLEAQRAIAALEVVASDLMNIKQQVQETAVNLTTWGRL